MMRDESSLIKKSRYRTWLLGGDTVFCERAIKGQKISGTADPINTIRAVAAIV